ncbi:MAG: hypothetical protein KGO96_12740 [Elusimicrobia bacterium]|nr:hypothetical protein [Elusimicrobiota bacterium]
MSSNTYITGEFTLLDDSDIMFSATASYAVTPEGVRLIEINIIRVSLASYELPADEGYDPEPMILDCRHVYQQLRLEELLMVDFETDILKECCEHASANAGVNP